MGGHVDAAVDGLVPPGEGVFDPHVEGVVDGDDAAAVAYVRLHRFALGIGVPDHAGVLQHDDDVEVLEQRVVEDGGVGGLDEFEVVCGRLFLEHLDLKREWRRAHSRRRG